jgi:tetratricopeptide (TPR) repeat protein
MLTLLKLGVDPALVVAGEAVTKIAGEGLSSLIKGITPRKKNLINKFNSTVSKTVSIVFFAQPFEIEQSCVDDVVNTVFSIENCVSFLSSENAEEELVSQIKIILNHHNVYGVNDEVISHTAVQLIENLQNIIRHDSDFSSIDTNYSIHQLLLCYYRQMELSKISFDQLNRNIESVKRELRVWPENINIEYIRKAQSIDEDEQKRAYKFFYKVTNDLIKISRIVCNDLDVVNDEAVKMAMQLINRADTVIITGMGGIGKTTLMFRIATTYASGLHPVFWLRPEFTGIMHTELSVRSMMQYMDDIAKAYQSKAILFIDNPNADLALLELIQKLQEEYRIKIVITERNNRISMILPHESYNFEVWNDEAIFLCLASKDTRQFDWIDEDRRIIQQIKESWKSDIIQRMIGVLEEYYQTNVEVLSKIVESIPSEMNNSSIVELIYYIMVTYNRQITRKCISLDWDEWDYTLQTYFGAGVRQKTFAYIAALYLFKIPTSVAILAKLLNRSHVELLAFIDETCKISSEPIIFEDGKIHLKHDMMADLYFKFHAVPPVELYLEELIPLMDEETAVVFEKICLCKRYVSGKDLMLHNVSCLKLIAAIEDSDHFEKYLENNNRLYSFDLAKFWIAQTTEDITVLHQLAINLEEKYPSHVRVQHALGTFYYSVGMFPKAEKAYLCALEAEPDNAIILSTIARLYSTFDRNKAEEAFLHALDIEPNNLVTLNTLAKFYIKIKQKDNAEKILQRALSLNPEHISSLYDLANLYIKDDYRKDEAKQILFKILDIAPSNVSTINSLVNLFLEERLFEEAEKTIHYILDMDQNNVVILSALAHFYIRSNQQNKAEEVFLRALNIEPSSVHILYSLARFYMKTDKIGKAEEIYLNTLRIYPDHIPTLNDLARFYLNSNQNEKAEETLLQIINIAPNNIPAHNKLFYLYLEENSEEKVEDILRRVFILDSNIKRFIHGVKERYFTANNNMIKRKDEIFLRALNIALQVAPNKYYVLISLADFYSKINQAEKAAEMFLDALDIDPDNLAIFNKLGRIYVETNQKEKAEKIYLRALEIDPDNLPILNELARFYIKTNRKNEAESVFIHAIDVDPNHVPILNELGKLYASTKRNEKAEETFLRALSIEPDSSYVLNSLARFYTMTNREEDAIIINKRALSFYPTDSRTICSLFNIYFKCGALEDARQVLLPHKRLFNNNRYFKECWNRLPEQLR